MRINTVWLEHHQSRLYFIAVACAWVTARILPDTQHWSKAINPALVMMLLLTFLQVPLTGLTRLRHAARFISALLTANFIVIPALLFLARPLLPNDALTQFGILLVLLAPCIDYVVTFTHLGRGDASRLLACTPLLLLAQMLLLPFYLALLLNDAAAAMIQPAPFMQAFVWLIIVPLVSAGIVQRLQRPYPQLMRACEKASGLTVPVTAVVIFLVVASVVPQLEQAVTPVFQAAPFYLAFAVIAPVVGVCTARLFGVDALGRRTVAFSCATRNSLVILPLALSIPSAIPLLPAILVTQTLIELIAETIYLRVLPRWVQDIPIPAQNAPAKE